jgi:hypothetical protein
MEITQCGLTAAAFCQRAKKVNIEDSPKRVKVWTAWKTIIAVHDACVIHQNIELSILRSYPLRCRRNCFFFQEVERSLRLARRRRLQRIL